MLDQSFEYYWSVLFGLILIRYFLIAGGAYWLFYRWQQPSLKRTLRRSPPSLQAIRTDIKLSVLSAIVFALGAAFILREYNLGRTLVYSDPAQYGLWYLAASFMTVLLLQDSYFYFIHRAAHHPRLFKWMHHGHHRSGDPSPWTSFAFDLPEALIQALFFVAIVFVIPLHIGTLIAVLLTMTLWAVWNHLGFELFPANFSRHWLTRWLIGPTHHAIHHRKYTAHYGLYFTLWDRLLGTQDPNYESVFDATLNRPSREL
ncbi:sterol desaturase family protein [Egbenema bharatensis]|uniref:sterol desaturase family protein n=1 Tax=Egbenema bharatensis TaxID=3463334 RepID=UPI003A8AB49E